MADLALSSPNTKSLRRHGWLGFLIVAVLGGGLMLWAAATEIAGAVVANGLVVIEGGSQRVQHPEGGIVSKIFVENEDVVQAGDLLVQLDGTVISANLGVILSQLREGFATQARLIAESYGAPQVEMPPLARDWPADAELDVLMAAQDRLRISRKAALDGQLARMAEQVSQIELQIEGLESQKQGVDAELAILTAERKDLEGLLERGLVEASRVNAIKREEAQRFGERGRIIAEIAGARAAIAERGVIRVQTVDEFQSEVLTNLQDVGQKIAVLLQQKIAAEDRLARLDIRAPVSGVIHESIVHTVGGVINPGETLMMVVPQENRLIIDARVSPIDIDKLTVDQAVVVRMSGLDTRATPELKATIRSISPDLSTDRMTGYQFYLIRIDVPDTELAKLPAGTKLVPGMPAEAFVQTGDRTVLSYLVKPLAEAISHTFRED